MAERSRGLAGAARSAVRGAVRAVRGGGSGGADEVGTPAESAAGGARPARKSAPAKKTTAKKPAAKKTTAKKATAKKATAKKATAKKATAKKATAKKTTAKKATTRKAPASALPVREDESPWTAAELEAVRSDLTAEVDRLRAEITAAEDQLATLIADSGDGGGEDQVDSGTKAFEREHEVTLANNAREALAQNLHALERIDAGTYGTCESCGAPIGKKRLQAFPRATLCVSCKQRQERH